jgi:hypothetical protein
MILDEHGDPLCSGGFRGRIVCAVVRVRANDIVGDDRSNGRATRQEHETVGCDSTSIAAASAFARNSDEHLHRNPPSMQAAFGETRKIQRRVLQS